MARLSDLREWERQHHLDKIRDLPDFGATPFAAAFHYSFMGAAPIRALEPKARALAGLLRKDNVDAVLLTPV